MNNRWIANKFGLFNFWYYDNQEFDLADGKILFRGTNGSGKSVTTQSFIPLLFDGDKRPNRIDPFGTKARKIENYLLIDDSTEERIAYLYMEFKKRETNTYMTIGMGLRAKRGKQQMDSCYFILKDGRRINKDIKLYKNIDNMLPITFKQLEKALGQGNFYTTYQQEYMKKVNENLFGYPDIESYKELLTLLIELRSPKLSKDFKPTVIYDILKKSLTTLSDDDLRTMAEAMDNMDSLNNKVEEFEKTLSACNKIKNEFDKYNSHIIYKAASKLNNKKNEVEAENKKIKSLKKTISENESTVSNQDSKLNNLNAELEAAKESYNKLEKSEAKRVKEDIIKEESRLKETTEKIQKASSRLDWKNKTQNENNQKIEELESIIFKKEKEIKDLLNDEKNLRIESYYEENDDFEKEISTNNSYSFDIILGSISNYEKVITEIFQLIVEYDAVKLQSEELEDKKESKVLDIKVNKNKLNEAIEYLTTIKSECIEAINKYLSNTSILTIEKDSLEKMYKIINSIENRYEYNNVLEIVRENKDKKQEELRDDKNKLILRSKEIDSSIDNIKRELEKRIKDKLIFNEDEWLVNAKKELDKEKIPYKKLYECIDFKENISDEEKKVIEGSLVEMGIINSLIIPDSYKSKLENILIEDSYKILSHSEEIVEENLSKYITLEKDNFTKEYHKYINSIIKSIGIKKNNNNSTYIDLESNFGIGILKGKGSNNQELKYIGSEKREQYRLSKIQELENNLENLNIIKESIDKSIEDIDKNIQTLNTEYREFISGEDIDEEIILIQEIEKELELQENEYKSLVESLHLVKQKLREINNRLFEETENIKIPKNTESYKKVIENLREYKEVINEIKEIYNYKHSKIEEKDIYVSHNEAVSIEIEDILNDIHYLKNKKLSLKKSIETLNSVLKSMGIDEIEEEINRLAKILDTYPNIIQNLRDDKVRREENIKNDKEKLEELEINFDKLYEQLKFHSENFAYEIKLGYTKDIINLDEAKAIDYVLHSYKQSGAYKDNAIISNIHEIIREHSFELNSYSIGVVDVDNLYANSEYEHIKPLIETSKRMDVSIKLNKKYITIYDLIDEINSNIEEYNLLINENERKVFEDILINTLSSRISARISRAKSWVRIIDNLMGNVNTSNGLKLSLVWSPKKSQSEDDIDTKELSTLLSTSKFLTDDEREKISKHFKSKLKQQKRRMEDEGKISSYQSIIKEVLDFREWFEFKLMYSTKIQNKKELTDNEFYRLSGGEKAMAMYIPLFAAVNARYDGADKKDCPRIISLDEAFAGVDDQNISNMFNLMESLNLDYVLNSQVLWGDYEGVKNLAIYELIREGSDMVIPINYYWNGKEKLVNLGE